MESTNESELAFGICEKISQVGSIGGKGMQGSKRRKRRRGRSLFWSGKEVAQGRAKDFGRLRTALENVKNMPLSVGLNFTVVSCRFSYKFPQDTLSTELGSLLWGGRGGFAVKTWEDQTVVGTNGQASHQMS